MPSERFVEALNDQIGREFLAAHQYTAVGAFYDRLTFPRLAKFFYEQADEERGHAMRTSASARSPRPRPTSPTTSSRSGSPSSRSAR